MREVRARTVLIDPFTAFGIVLYDPVEEVLNGTVAHTVANYHHWASIELPHGLDVLLEVREIAVPDLELVRRQTPIVLQCRELSVRSTNNHQNLLANVRQLQADCRHKYTLAAPDFLQEDPSPTRQDLRDHTPTMEKRHWSYVGERRSKRAGVQVRDCILALDRTDLDVCLEQTE